MEVSRKFEIVLQKREVAAPSPNDLAVPVYPWQDVASEEYDHSRAGNTKLWRLTNAFRSTATTGNLTPGQEWQVVRRTTIVTVEPIDAAGEGNEA